MKWQEVAAGSLRTDASFLSCIPFKTYSDTLARGSLLLYKSRHKSANYKVY